MNNIKITLDLLKAGAKLPEKYNHELRGWRLWVLNTCQILSVLGFIALIWWVISLFTHG